MRHFSNALIVFGLVISGEHPSAQTQNSDLTICQPPDCDLRRSLPISFEAPLATQEFFKHVAKETLVSSLDFLPALTLEEWLSATLAPYIEISRAPFADWMLSFCTERQSAVPRAGPDLCVEVRAPISVSKTVVLMVQVAEGRSSLDGRTGWQAQLPTVHEIYVEHHESGNTVDSLDVPKLSALAALLQLEPEKWPSVDLRSAVTLSPQRWSAGDMVRFGIWVENVGKRDADRAHVQVLVGIAPAGGGDVIEIRRHWFPRVPAGQRVAFEIPARLPRGDATVVVSVGGVHGPKRVREANPDDNDTIVLVGPDVAKRTLQPTGGIASPGNERRKD
jgi:hypothetical protein